MHHLEGLTRRDFLKLISLVPATIYSRPIMKLAGNANVDTPNVIIIVFDAWSQHNVSLYGYRRRTMPNLEKFAENATIFHRHYSPGVFTVPSTASLLTGLYPWSHRAFQLSAGISHTHTSHSIFAALSRTHSTLAFTQNELADEILFQLEADLDEHATARLFDVQRPNLYGAHIFDKDHRIAYASLHDNLVQLGSGFDSSMFFGPLYRLRRTRERTQIKRQYKRDYPLGLPRTPSFYLLSDVVQGAIDLLKGIQQPALTYLHFWTPHEPYAPSKDFFGTFSDGWNPPEKQVHSLSDEKNNIDKLRVQRRYYDEYVANWDDEVARLFQFLKESRLTETSYIIVTADHGEMFERGELGHRTRTLYDPVIHIPLIILSPGQTQRKDVHSFTSSIDLLPTLANLTGNPIPDWIEGKLLPMFGGAEDDRRSIFSMEARTNSSFTPLIHFSASITRDHHRLVYYHYPRLKYENYEFYDLDADLEEMNDLYPSSPSLAKEMQDELQQKISEVDKPFQHSSL